MCYIAPQETHFSVLIFSTGPIKNVVSEQEKMRLYAICLHKRNEIHLNYKHYKIIMLSPKE